MVESRVLGIAYSSWVSEAEPLAQDLADRLGKYGTVWMCPVSELDSKWETVPNPSLLVSVGGDGTILRAVRTIAKHDVPLLGVNLGRVGFMTELSVSDALSHIDEYIEGSTWVEERAMLQATVLPGGSDDGSSTFHGLNDAVVGRGTVARLVYAEVTVDGQLLASYATDAVVISTATGSSGYILSAGGPVLYPESNSLIVKPVVPQMADPSAVVLRPGAVVEVFVQTNHQAMLSVDGFDDWALKPEDVVRVEQSPYKAKFLRTGQPRFFPAGLAQRLSSSRKQDQDELITWVSEGRTRIDRRKFRWG